MSASFSAILFPADFSELSLRALDCAKGMAEQFGASLHCLHVVDEAYQYWTGVSPESVPVGPPPDELLEIGRQRMACFVSEYMADLPQAPTTHVMLGRPFAGIVQYARANGIDMIVMATHGRGGIAHVLLGSTAEKVVRKAHCAVLTVRTAEGEFVHP